MEFNAEPDYNKVRQIFANALKKYGGKLGSPLVFDPNPAKRKDAGDKQKAETPKKKLRSVRKKPEENGETDELETEEDVEIVKPKRGTKKKVNGVAKAMQNGDSEKELVPKKRTKKADAENINVEENMTAAMKEVIQKKKERTAKKDIFKPSTSKGKVAAKGPPKTHCDVVDLDLSGSSSGSIPQTVTKRKNKKK